MKGATSGRETVAKLEKGERKRSDAKLTEKFIFKHPGKWRTVFSATVGDELAGSFYSLSAVTRTPPV